MALPPAEIDGKPWYEERQSWWSGLGARGQGYFITGFVFVAIWAAEAVPPLFESDHVVGLCGKYGVCLPFPASEFVLGEVVVSLLWLGFAAGAFTAAFLAARRWKA